MTLVEYKQIKRPGFFERFFKRKSLQKQVENLPQSYFVGQEYVLDPDRIPVEIQVFFLSSGEVKTVTLNIGGKVVSLRQDQTTLRVEFTERISKKLFYNIKAKTDGDSWILPYISEVMPYVNQEILRQRYGSGHFLISTYSNTDIYLLRLLNKKTKERIQVDWPRTITAFDKAMEVAGIYNRVYIRDLIDSIHEYFKGNYEECIRKSITSIETFVKYHNLEIRKENGGLNFEKTVRKNLNFKCPMISDETTADAIWRGYIVRNKIVHDGERLDPKEGQSLGKRLTHMVNEVYKNFGNEEELKRYAMYLEGQFLMLENFLGIDSLSLKVLEKFKREEDNIDWTTK